MCFNMKTPEINTPERPKTDDSSSMAKKARKAASEQQGVFANIFTTPLGDSGYESNVAAAR